MKTRRITFDTHEGGRFAIVIKPEAPRKKKSKDEMDVEIGVLLFKINIFLQKAEPGFGAYLEEFDKQTKP